MGETELYLGERPSPLRTRYALLKHLPRARRGYLALREHMIEEGRFADKLSHPSFLSFLDADEDDSGFTLAYESPSGIDLGRTVAELAKRDEALPFELVVHIARELARAAAHAHREHALVLRELKPENVFVTKAGLVSIATYGLDLGHSEHQPNLEEELAHLAPECLSRSEYSISSDVYALGVLLFTMLAGRPPPSGGPVPLEQLDDEGVPEPLIAIVARAAHPARAERYRDALLLASKLESWLASCGAALSQEIVAGFFAQHLL
jgi:serine/threonine protein kinase